MLPTLDPIEARILGALLEKSITTPEYYPLSLNALLNACNQKSNRDPVLTLDEETVRNAASALGHKGLVAYLRDARATKYQHRLAEVLNLGRRDEAILCELLLRGPQTPGELRGRTERLHPMAEVADVQSTLQRMIERQPDPLVLALPRQPGTKEVRYAHLLSGPPDLTALAPPSPSARENHLELHTRIATLEERTASLQSQLDDLSSKLTTLLTQLT